jgi:phytoene desaturase (3,4-didehydrolycopene-forming)
VFAPLGGFQAVTDALESLAKDLGVDIQCNSTVIGVRDDGVFVRKKDSSSSSSITRELFLSADLIVVNADLPYSKKSLLIDNDQGTGSTQSIPLVEKFDWDDSFSFSSGVISFHWSIDKLVCDLNTHNVFLVGGSRSQAEASWHVLRMEGIADDGKDVPFNFYVHRPSKTDPSAAPVGCDAIMVLVPCQTLLRDEDCTKLPRDEAIKRYRMQFSDDVVSKVRKSVLTRMAAVDSLRNLDRHIVDEVVDTPGTWADQYHLAAGTPFALVRVFIIHENGAYFNSM